MPEKFIVSAGRCDYPIRCHDPETGEYLGDRTEYRYMVSFTTAYGIEYTHRLVFLDNADGSRIADGLATRIQTVLDAKGLVGLNEVHWATRVIYGSQAYIDEEPYIVAREREDDRMGGY